MKIVVKKEDLYNGIKIVEKAAGQKTVLPILANILIETINQNSIRLVAQDMEMAISTIVDAQVEEEGKITLPSKTLNDIVSKLSNKLITIEFNESEGADSTVVNITCQNSKFDLVGISAAEFPSMNKVAAEQQETGLDIEIKPFLKGVKQAGFAVSSADLYRIFSGVVCKISGQTLEIASTDGNRLARVRESIQNQENSDLQLVIPSKVLNEFIRISSYIEDESVKLTVAGKQIILNTSKISMVAQLLEGKYPDYNVLIPQDCQKNATVNVAEMETALDRVSTLVNEKTSIVKLEFTENNLKLTADTPNMGKSEETMAIDYTGEDITIAFNYKYILDVLRHIESEEVKIGLNTNLSASVFRPNTDEDFVCLVMPVRY